jgi:predicted permease
MSEARPPVSDRVFAWLLRMFPREFRGDFAEQMADDFRDQREEARASGRPLAAPGLWARTAAGVLRQAPQEHFDLLRRDVQYAVRLLRRTPGFTAVAVLTLAFGIGTNTAIFSLADGMLFRPLPFRDPGRLILVHGFETRTGTPYNFVPRIDFEQLRAQHSGIGSIAVIGNTAALTWTGIDGVESMSTSTGTPNVLEMLGVGAHVGRALRPGDESIQPIPAMLTYAAWSRRFGEDPSVVGRTLTFEQRTVQIVGVLPKRFIYPLQGSLARGELLMVADLPAGEAADPRAGVWSPVARLKPGISIEQAQSEADVLIQRAARQFPETQQDRAVRIANLQFALFELSRPLLWLLVGAASCVLLIACANLGTLLMARAAVREREIGIRVAIGAGRGRIIRQLFVEALVLGGLSGIVALLIGWLTFRTLIPHVPSFYRLLPETLDTRAMVFTAVASVVASLLFGLFPALSLSRHDPGTSIREGRRLGPRPGGLMKAGGPLVAVEVALGFILFTGTALTVNSLVRMRTVDLGFEPTRVFPLGLGSPSNLATRFPTPAARYDFFDQLLQSVRRLPNVQAAGAIDLLPWSGARPMRVLRKSRQPGIGVWTITPGYFQAAGIPILLGQDFTDDDVRQNAAVAIVNATVARLLWPGESALGKMLDADADRQRRVIGVVKDVRSGYGGTAEAAVYWPMTREGFRMMTVLARSAGDPDALAVAMRTTAQQLDPRLLVGRVGRPQPVSVMLDRTIAAARFETLLFSLFGVLGLIVTTIGVYGLMAFWVATRTREMGVRLALGADAAKLKSIVLKRASIPLAVGLGAGFIGAFVLTRRLESLLFEITPHDPATLAAVVAVLLAAGLGAAYIPARRAARVDPIVTLRAD